MTHRPTTAVTIGQSRFSHHLKECACWSGRHSNGTRGVSGQNDPERERSRLRGVYPPCQAPDRLATLILTVSQRGSQLTLLLPSRGRLLCLDTLLVVTAGLGVLLACARERPEMLPSVLRHTGRPPHKEVRQVQMSPALTMRNSTMNLKDGGFLSCLI